MDITYIYIASAVVLTLSIIYFLFFRNKVDYHQYKDDTLYDVHWKWEWKKDDIINLKCHCPICDDILVYENDYILHKTYFLCPTCDIQKAVIGGGDSKYSMGIVKREINRKIRTEEYLKIIN